MKENARKRRIKEAAGKELAGEDSSRKGMSVLEERALRKEGSKSSSGGAA